MKRIVYIVCAVLLIANSMKAQELTWGKRLGGTSNDAAYFMTVDAAGNQYITGPFTGTADFDPGPEVYNLSSFGFEDIYICKLDPSGNFVWAKQLGGANYDYGRSLAIDVNGNILITGSFMGSADFDPGPGVFILNSAGSWDIFICKLDASGNLVWANGFGNHNEEDKGNYIVVDAVGNSYITGSFKYTIDFDPGAGVNNLTAGYIDQFICKMDPSGNLIWARNMGGPYTDAGYAIAVDAAGNVFSTGSFLGVSDFDPGPGTFYLNSNITGGSDADLFVSKLDANGNFVWARQLSGWDIYYCYGYGISVDAAGNVYTTGAFKGTVDFNPDAGVLNIPANGLNDCFVLKLNASGNFVWAKILGGCQLTDYGTSILVDPYGNVYTVGLFQYIADFDPGPGVYEIHANGNIDVFLSKIDSDGNFKWAIKIGNGYNDYAYSLALDPIDNIFVAGHFESAIDLDTGPEIYNLISAGSTDIFIAKFTQDVWKGTVSNAWNDSANWATGRIPTAANDVVIPSGLTRYPTVSVNTEVKSLTIKNGAVVSIASGFELRIKTN